MRRICSGSIGRKGRNSDAAGHADHVAEVRAGPHEDVLHDVPEAPPSLDDAVVEDGEPLLKQDDVGRVLGHVDGVLDRDADVGRVERGRVVDAVAQAADDVAARRGAPGRSGSSATGETRAKTVVRSATAASAGSDMRSTSSPRTIAPGASPTWAQIRCVDQLVVAGQDLDRDPVRAAARRSSPATPSRGGSRKAAKPTKVRSRSSATRVRRLRCHGPVGDREDAVAVAR